MAAPFQPKTLASARAVIRELEAKKGLPRSSESAPGSPAPSPPVTLAPAPGIPTPRDPGPVLPAAIDPELSPKRMAELLGNMSTRQLKMSLGAETSRPRKTKRPGLIASLYAELKKRKQ
jgi:hypothetical protein